MDVRESPVDGFLDVSAVATHVFEPLGHHRELVEMGCKERAGTVYSVEVVKAGVCYGQSVHWSSSSSYFVHDDLEMEEKSS